MSNWIEGNTLVDVKIYHKGCFNRDFNNIGCFSQIKPDFRHNNQAQIGFGNSLAVVQFLCTDRKRVVKSIYLYFYETFMQQSSREVYAIGRKLQHLD